ncbi:hypothetical protein [Pseudofrankia asymbiotica]|uniref:Uncharacterized protein n=1 Tax=Pseudofrankia asymbiotica TaxID=1834516 RepID=A0A1V2I495_9ACTN|nr:hypothetical protein [Pseudofrankia asymbiotica]ONH24880.1 hypothetical protein BL253_28820 [Pseudofrankia asymbiotica]
MIVRIDYDLGIQVEATGPEPDGVMTYEELVFGLLMIFPNVNRVRLWERGRTVDDRPSADAFRMWPNPDDAALGKDLSDAHADFLADLASVLDLDSGLARIVHDKPDWDEELRDGPNIVPPV